MCSTWNISGDDIVTLADFLASRKLEPELEVQLLKLMGLCLAWNEKINVTAIRDPEDFIQKNLIDSLSIIGLPAFDDAVTVLDIGTGGGFPGLPLALAFPEKEFLLVDSVGKKLKVVADIAEQLGLENVTVRQARAEDLAQDPAYREQFDLVVSRAVAVLPVLAEYCLPFVHVDGSFAAYKTAASDLEIDDAERAFEILGGELDDVVPNGVSGSGHIFVVAYKTRPTPKKYPRKTGQPQKNPL